MPEGLHISSGLEMPREELGSVGVERDVWSLLLLLPPPPDPDGNGQTDESSVSFLFSLSLCQRPFPASLFLSLFTS